MGNIARQVAQLSLPVESGGIDAPVVLLHHLNRDAANGRTPTTAALGGSDQIGYWASQVLLVSEEKGYTPGGSEFAPAGSTHAIHVTKNRGGRAGLSVPLHFIGEQMRFEGAGAARPFDKPAAADIATEKDYRQRLSALPAI